MKQRKLIRRVLLTVLLLAGAAGLAGAEDYFVRRQAPGLRESLDGLLDCSLGGPAASACRLLSGWYASLQACSESVTANCQAADGDKVYEATRLIDDGEGLRWADGTMAVSCKAYRDASGGYEAATADGTYWVDIDGGSTSNAQRLWCDQSGSGGGWTLVMNGDGSFSGWSGSTGAVNATTLARKDGRAAKLSDAQINQLVTERYRMDRVYPAASAIFWSGGCSYNHSGQATGACAAAYGDVGLTSSLSTTNNSCHAGLAAWGNGNCPGGGNAHYAITSHICSDTWWVGTAPSGGCPLYWGNGSSNPSGRFRIFVR